MVDPLVRLVSNTGGRLHWARPGYPYALCGSAVVAADPVGPLSEANLPECKACARKRVKIQARFSR